MIDDQIRKYVRADIDDMDNIEVSITRIASNKGEAVVNPIKVRPLNLSARGVKFNVNLALTTGIMLELRIKVQDKIVTSMGKVVRMEEIEKGFNYAVSFTMLKEYNKIIISSFVKRKTIDHIQQLRGE